MTPPLSIALCGAGGYGERYLTALLAEAEARNCRLAGIIEPFPKHCSQWPEIVSRSIPTFSRLEEFYAVAGCDLLIISSPIHFHCAQTCLALAHGSHVLCEKPLCTSVEQIEQMKAAEMLSGKSVTIGYQWSFSPAIQKLKGDLLEGRFGCPLQFQTLICWPRGDRYYRRNDWAGRLRTKTGERLLDSPVNNAMAHYLHNMLYLLGSSIGQSATATVSEAELWRVNPIESFETAALRLRTESGVELQFLASHVTADRQDPRFRYEFEQAVIDYSVERKNIIATLRSGEKISYGSPEDEPCRKLWQAVNSARTGASPLCGIDAASAHTRCVNHMHDAGFPIHDFPSSSIEVDHSGDAPRCFVPGLQEALNRCYDHRTLLAEEWRGAITPACVLP
ncbi:MAG: hypothetical protein B9S32_09590 [Verrucomicrobia bacterium Tous-C9LFEB]|nr:MAG: hypothetical protein B9S32_09590 [Verrucomicrobia bacterium Tous-C9LFEB]